MTMIVSAAFEANWPEAVPRDYNELYKNYAPFIAKIIQNRNKIDRDFKELLQHVWERLVHVDVIGKFVTHADKQVTKTMTAEEACVFLGISFNQWRTAMWAHHGKGRKNAHWMPMHLNVAEFEAAAQAKPKAKHPRAGEDTVAMPAGITSKKALFDFNDVVQLQEYFTSTGQVWPEIKITKAHFQNYLSMAVNNIFANWCRTKVRKHKERTADGLMPLHEGDEAPAWEQTLPDPDEDATHRRAQLAEATAKIRLGLAEVLGNVPDCKPVSDHEQDLFERLSEGYTLTEAVRKLDLPTRYKERALKVIQRKFADKPTLTV